MRGEKIERVERGEDYFTLRQIKRLSGIYRVPLAAFFSDSVPHIPSLPDYRVNREKRIPPTVNLAIRWARYLSGMVHEVSGESTTLPDVPKDLMPGELAEAVRRYLSPEPPKGAPSRILDYYKRLVEGGFNIIVIEYPLRADDVRGFNIRGDLSVIVLNESDEAPVKLFSLFHEIGHLLRGESGICSITMEEQADIENYCNRFAAEFLLPEDAIREYAVRYGTDYEALRKIQRRFGVSMHAIMIRLLNLGLISQKKYEEFRGEFKEEVRRAHRRNWEATYKNRAGYLALEEVSRAYRRGDISFYESMRILNLKAKYAEKLIG